MKRRWLSLLGDSRDRRRLLLFAGCAVSSFLIGWVFVRPPTTERLIVSGGYFYISAVFALWLFYAWRVGAARRAVWSSWLRRPGWTAVILCAATAFAVGSDAFAHKVLFDEYVLQGTAWHMHLTKEIGTPLRAYDIHGTWVVIDTFLDKRPYFFPFLISLLHDLTGFRLANVFALNVLVAFALLASTYWLVNALTSKRSASWLAVALLATLPLFGQNVTGGNMELLNVAMIAVTMIAATLYVRAPSDDRLSLLVLGAVLLAQTRYESVLYVFPVAAAVVLGWWRAGRVMLSWPAMLTPVLLVPYLWHDRFVASKPILWQLREGEEARFAWRYLAGNLEGARNFFFNLSPSQPNSVWLVLLGGAGFGWAAVRLGRYWRDRRRSRPALDPMVPVVGFFATTVAAALALLMFYYWSRLDDPIATRFALPFCFTLAIAAGWLVHALEVYGIPAVRIGAFGLGAWLVVIGAPTYAHRFYTNQNLVMHELEWELEQAQGVRGPMLWVTTKATMPFLLRHIPALNTVAVPARASQIAWHLREGTFRDVFVSQVLRPTSIPDQTIVDPDDELPANFHLTTVSEKRFGGRWIRISRVDAITLGEPASPSPAPAIPGNERAGSPRAGRGADDE